MASHTNPKSNIARIHLDERELYHSEGFWMRGFRRLRRDPLSMISLSVLTVLVVITVFAPLINNYILKVDPNLTDPSIRLMRPFSAESIETGHLLGTDDLGRDYLGRLLQGGRISLAIGFFGAVITLAIGVSIGMVAGYFGGPVDDAINWAITTLDSIPSLYLLILITVILRPSAQSLILVLALVGWTGGTRLMRGQTIALRHQEYIISAEALGATPWRIMFVHIFPNLLSILTVVLTRGIGNLILVESVLSFFSLGVLPPTPTWGNMLTNAQDFFRTGPHMATISGLMIFITVLCLYVLGDGLRDAFDPELVD